MTREGERGREKDQSGLRRDSHIESTVETADCGICTGGRRRRESENTSHFDLEARPVVSLSSVKGTNTITQIRTPGESLEGLEGPVGTELGRKNRPWKNSLVRDGTEFRTWDESERTVSLERPRLIE